MPGDMSNHDPMTKQSAPKIAEIGPASHHRAGSFLMNGVLAKFVNCVLRTLKTQNLA